MWLSCWSYILINLPVRKSFNTSVFATKGLAEEFSHLDKAVVLCNDTEPNQECVLLFSIEVIAPSNSCKKSYRQIKRFATQFLLDSFFKTLQEILPPFSIEATAESSNLGDDTYPNNAHSTPFYSTNTTPSSLQTV